MSGRKAFIEILKKHRLTIADLRAMNTFQFNGARFYELLNQEWWAPGQAFAWFLKTYKNGVLKRLDFNHIKISDEGAKALASALNVNETLTDLNLDGSWRPHPSLGHSRDGALSIMRVERHRNKLTSLGLINCDIGPSRADAAEIADFVSVSEVLETLSLTDNFIGNDGAVAIAEALKVNRVLTTLNLENNGICSEGAAALGKALEVNGKLKSLSLSLNGIRDAGAAAIAEALRFNGVLTALNINCNKIGDRGAKALASALHVNGMLKTLDLGSNNIGGEGAVAIADALQNNAVLTTLDLSGDPYTSGIGPEGASAIAEALKVNGVLTTLNLSENYISTSLNLSENYIRDEGARAVALLASALRVNEGLKILHIRDCGYSFCKAIRAAVQGRVGFKLEE
ncbi:hypothetical protein EMIHUDRAFT_230541 [Emiliania huxleyi CCMP1516]|uniref:Uncharacterized protein n=2 Tax=Emiliania huxleyi TaxID=2903 RepID=A0A0D3KAF0_EMIH1|nr:hypothetical protein EMIHUDRAFT_230541 [Emiliania huxleyi CCMP1516]EOD32735.1 hypothetical protein EMIHUDRAFT_230541 [Emiliania huxleyi CCMP1516]|eukprot:XP_005785164.1 hypothetical protein EMIHUDRAFT_230541 [Emiliania huxleyi CCMP1516]